MYEYLSYKFTSLFITGFKMVGFCKTKISYVNHNFIVSRLYYADPFENVRE